MKIIEIETSKILYDSKGEEKLFVVSEFWKALKSGKIQYMSGATKAGIRYSEILILNLEVRNFDVIFKKIANSGIGREVMEGRMPVNTRL